MNNDRMPHCYVERTITYNCGLTSFGMKKKLFIFIFSACIIAIHDSFALMMT